jgi:hypothetical protein
MTYHTPVDKPPYIQLIDSGRIIDVGDEVYVEIVINKQPETETIQVDNKLYTVEPKEFTDGYQCAHCCFKAKSVEFCYNFKCKPDERDDNRQLVYKLIDVKEVE